MNGIGGNTIAKAKEAISYTEYLEWVEFINRHGSLNLAKHIERGFALVAHITSVAHKIKSNGVIPGIKEFMPHYKEPEISLEEAMRTWH